MSPDGTTRMFITPALGGGLCFLSLPPFPQARRYSGKPGTQQQHARGLGNVGTAVAHDDGKVAAASSGFWVDES